ncbi:putative ternary complex factor MIP1 [Tanacetum coccineum]|uniref:Ternary complex factor MIP1 n=1 Tax=Tanacetum coccineum TaxID=301880 RepID=A0ABQ5AL84_9ASTR
MHGNSGDKQKTIHLQQEVEELKAELEDELKLSKILEYALDGPIHPPCPCFSTQTHLPFKVIGICVTVEEEISWLERKVDKLNLSLYLEKKQTREWELQQLKELHPSRHHRSRKQSLRKQQTRQKFTGYELQDYHAHKRRSSFGSSTNIKYDKLQLTVLEPDYIKNPNKLSEELITCLIGIFLELNQPFQDSEEGSDIVPKHISCMNSKSFISKTAFNCTAPASFYSSDRSNQDPYAILLDYYGSIQDIGPYKTFTQITRNTLDHTRISECSTEVGKLRGLMKKLCSVNLNLLTYKQKLAFWINAFLQHGLPSTQEKLLFLMNKGPADKREMLLRQAYGLGFPEPNVTFALCRGSWSSPALRVYTAEDIVNELARARLEYLEASVGVISKKKIMVPKLLQWHIKDFADDMESLLGMGFNKAKPATMGLPSKGDKGVHQGLKTKSTAKMIEIQPYVYEFRYLLPS